MSLITLRKYLNAVDPKGPEPASGDVPVVTHTACAQRYLQVLSELNRFAAAVVPEVSKQTDWETLLRELTPALEAGQQETVRGRVIQLVDGYRQAYEERDQRRTHEMQQMLTTLNDALLALASGSDRSIERLRQVETSLTKASQMDDIMALKARLTATVQFVRAESEQHSKDSSATLRGFEQQFRSAQQTVGGGALPGREAAVGALARLANEEDPGLVVVVCQAQRLRAMQSRYGAAMADDIIRSFVRSVVRAQAKPGMIFSWKDDALLWFVPAGGNFAATRDAIQNRLNEGYEHRTVTAGRAVILKIAFKTLTKQAKPETLGSLPEEIDAFLQ